MISKDIMFDIEGGRFNYRVGAIIIDSGEILMTKNSDTPFYYTVGGRVRMGESAEEAVIREAFEETQILLEIDRLAYVHENFFVLESDGNFYHEISLFFLMKPSPALREAELVSFTEEGYGDIELHWLPISSLGGLRAYPDFLKDELPDISKGIKHFVTKGGVTMPRGCNP